MTAQPPSTEPPKDRTEDTVITPAGRLPRDRVTHVPPGHHIRRNDDGTYSIIEDDAEHKSKDQPSSNPEEK
jgi:hypothetical protein